MSAQRNPPPGPTSHFLLFGLLLAVLPAATLAQGWVQQPRAVFDITTDTRGADKRLDAPGEQLIGLSSTDSDGGRQGLLLAGQNFLNAGYSLEAAVSLVGFEGEVLKSRVCRIDWTLTNTSVPAAALITAFDSGIPELDDAVDDALPLVRGDSVTATKTNGCRVTLRNISGPTFNRIPPPRCVRASTTAILSPVAI